MKADISTLHKPDILILQRHAEQLALLPGNVHGRFGQTWPERRAPQNPMGTGAKIAYEFGPFRVDPDRRVLLRENRPVAITPKAFEILLILIRHNHEDLTKDELINCVWPDAFVEESNLSQNIFMLRRALGETPEDRRYIVTLPGRGYRFAAEVRTVTQDDEDLVVHRHSLAQVLLEQTDGARVERPVAVTGGAHWPFEWHYPIALSLVVGLLALGTATFIHKRRPPSLGETKAVLISDFKNTTGDPVFDGTLQQGLEMQLEQSPNLTIVSDERIKDALDLMGRPSDTRLTPDVAREICQRTGSTAVLEGSIARLGSQYVVGLRARGCRGGSLLADEQMQAARKEDVLKALDQIARRFRTQLGESFATLERYDAPLAQVTTPSLDALNAYSLGRRRFWEKGVAAALPYSQRAIELDPNFAMAYRALGVEYRALGEVERANAYGAKAFELRDHASEREKLEIMAGYYSTVTGELEKAVQADEEEVESYPLDGLGYLNLSVEYAALGQYEKAADLTRHGMRLAPDQTRYHEALATYALALGRVDETQQVLRDAQAHNVDDFGVHSNLYALAFLGADFVAMAAEQQWFESKPQYESYGLALASDTEAYVGRAAKAQELTERAVDSAKRSDNQESAALWQANAALRQAAYGNVAAARQSATAALKLAPTSQGVESEMAMALAMAGDTARAQPLSEDLGKRYPLDTQIQTLWLPAIHAQLALDKNSPISALNVLRASSLIEFGNIPFGNNVSCLYHVYIRGQVYLKAEKGTAAAKEFQKILDHNGIVWNCWTGALAHLGVARANALQSTISRSVDADVAHARALAAYQDFLTLWKDADPDIPILKEAKAEYAKLK